MKQQPYKFLYSFGLEDAHTFFGRELATENFYGRVMGERLIVLCAPSGAGKTSLLNAGLSPRLIQAGHAPIYVRAYDDPIHAIQQALAALSGSSEPPFQLSLRDGLAWACARSGRQGQELVIILDQFEDFFISRPERERRQPLIDALADSYDDKTLPLHIVIGLREDYASHLLDFQRRIPSIMHDKYYIDPMTRWEAQAAVVQPAARLTPAVSYEPDLLTLLLDDLAHGGMKLPHLQITCTRLYEALAEGETRITLTAYEALGRAQGILSDYLDDVLDGLPGQAGKLARRVLQELVKAGFARRALSYAALAERIEAGPDELGDVLSRLVNARLLRRNEVAGQVTYEVAHDYVAEGVMRWNEPVVAFEQVEQVLVQEAAHWRARGMPLPRGRLELVYAQRERFRQRFGELDHDMQLYLLHSAALAGFSVRRWVEMTGEVGERLFLAAFGGLDAPAGQAVARLAMAELPELRGLGHTNEVVRTEAAEALGLLDDRRIVVVGPLIAALHDESHDVRQAAATALWKLGDSIAVPPLLAALQDEDKWVRRAAVGALGKLGHSRAVEPLTAALQDRDHNVRQTAALALGQLGDLRAVPPLVAALRDEDDDVRWTAAEILGQFGDPRAVPPLVAALDDERSGVRQVVAEALGRLGDPRAVPPLGLALRDKHSGVRQAAAEALARIGPPAIPLLVAALEDERDSVRAAAAGALKKIGAVF